MSAICLIEDSSVQSLFPVGLTAQWHSQVSSSLPTPLKNWLFDASSLTARLKQHCQHFKVQVLGQQVMPCDAIDATHDIAQGEPVLVREVLLHCDGEAHVFARSLLPLSSLTGEQQQLASLGEQPLGQVIFNQANMQRSAIEVAAFAPEQYAKLTRLLTKLEQNCERELWGRRSTFFLADKPLMVSEIFLPPALAYQQL